MKNAIFIEKKRKYFLFNLCSSIVVLTSTILAVFDYIHNDFIEFKICILIISITIIAGIALRKFNSDIVIYRVGLLLLSLIFLYSIPKGVGQGTSLYWIYSLPLVFFFFFGKREGLVWFIIFFSCLCFELLTPEVFGWYSYGQATVLRFIVTINTVTIIGYGLESSRYFSSKSLEEKNQALGREKQQLELALKEIKTLSGLIPICSGCKKIRNDEGYWEQVEVYIRDRSSVDFTHGICPECIIKLYPDYADPVD